MAQKTLVDTDSVQTLTNKTLTAPVIDTPTISGPTLSGSAIGTYTLAGTPTITSPQINSPSISSPSVTGLVTLSDGQIVFPSTQNASANVHTLDDYEEGAWTPALGGSATYTSRIGQYVKIGRLVHVSCTMLVDAIGTGSQWTISGLPFPADAGGAIAVGIDTASANIVSVIGKFAGGLSSLSLFSRTVASASGSNVAVIGSGTAITLSGSYTTAN